MPVPMLGHVSRQQRGNRACLITSVMVLLRDELSHRPVATVIGNTVDDGKFCGQKCKNVAADKRIKTDTAIG